MRIDKIEFNRVKGGELEVGLLINEGDGPIIDQHGKEVPECWDYRRTNNLTVIVEMGEKK